MIDENIENIGNNSFNVFKIQNDGFYGEGNQFTKIECRISDMKYEGSAFFIDIQNSTELKTGDYTPIIMEKREVEEFIEYLKREVVKMK